jgi:preprotein translocase subunit SecF
MKKIKWLFIVIGLLLVVGIGTKVYMDKNEGVNMNSNQNILIKQEQLAIYIVQNYESIEEIEFENAYEVKKTGTWHVSAIINKDNILKISLEESRSPRNPRIGYNPDDFQLIEKVEPDDADLSKIKVIYLEEDNE